MAGFCNWFKNERRFVILITAANESMIKVHDRMPLILEKEALEDWFDDKKRRNEGSRRNADYEFCPVMRLHGDRESRVPEEKTVGGEACRSSALNESFAKSELSFARIVEIRLSQSHWL